MKKALHSVQSLKENKKAFYCYKVEMQCCIWSHSKFFISFYFLEISICVCRSFKDTERCTTEWRRETNVWKSWLGYDWQSYNQSSQLVWCSCKYLEHMKFSPVCFTVGVSNTSKQATCLTLFLDFSQSIFYMYSQWRKWKLYICLSLSDQRP